MLGLVVLATEFHKLGCQPPVALAQTLVSMFYSNGTSETLEAHITSVIVDYSPKDRSLYLPKEVVEALIVLDYAAF